MPFTILASKGDQRRLFDVEEEQALLLAIDNLFFSGYVIDLVVDEHDRIVTPQTVLLMQVGRGDTGDHGDPPGRVREPNGQTSVGRALREPRNVSDEGWVEPEAAG